ncbi:MAG: hypothetical protein QXT14_02735 [Candidatus Bathyarchaeia archaeon]
MPARGHVTDFSIRCKRPDGTWIEYTYFPPEYGGPMWWDPDQKKYVTRVRCSVGAGNILLYSGCIAVSNYGDSAGIIFGDLYQDSTRILYKSVPNVQPDWGFTMPDYDKYLDMPSGGLTLTLKAGHDTSVDETVTLPIDPWVEKAVITAKAVLTLIALSGITFLCILLERKR